MFKEILKISYRESHRQVYCYVPSVQYLYHIFMVDGVDFILFIITNNILLLINFSGN